MTTKALRYKTNPFLEGMEIAVGSKSVRISTLGKSENILVNQVTGEVSGTHVVARKRVDRTKFVKTFADYMAFTFDLSKAGNKVLRVLMWAVKETSMGKDVVVMDSFTLEAFLAYYGDTDPPLILSLSTFNRGLAELEKAKIIAKTIRFGAYFINPNCIFNGDRVAFTTVIERAPEEQRELFSGQP